jgi:uncharacterized phiE125 gp8 family phage protein
MQRLHGPRGHLRLRTAPTTLPLTLDECKAHLRVTFNDDDGLIKAYAAAAVKALDGKSGHLGRCLMPQIWRQTLDGGFPAACGGRDDRIDLPLGPVRSVTAVTYVDANGATQPLSSTAYDFFADDGLEAACLRPVYGTAWPATRRQPDAVVIDYDAGYASAAEVPEPIKAAILLHVGFLYENPSAVGANTLDQLPLAYTHLLAPYRRANI